MNLAALCAIVSDAEQARQQGSRADKSSIPPDLCDAIASAIRLVTDLDGLPGNGPTVRFQVNTWHGRN
jgi:hypothetical protein